MKAARIYKDNFRENPLFSLFFAETSPIILLGIVLAVSEIIVFVVLFGIHPEILLVVAISEMGLFIMTTGKKDNEVKYKGVLRQLAFPFSKKHYDTKELDKTISDFSIVGNYIKRRKKLIAVYELYPSDITFMDNEALEQFYQNIKLSYHNLATKMMLIAKKQPVTATDYNSHFYALYTSADTKREPLVRQYQEELSAFIDGNSFKRVKYYAVFSTHLLSESDAHFAKASKKLFEAGSRYTSSLLSMNIAAKQLSQEELRNFFTSEVQL